MKYQPNRDYVSNDKRMTPSHLAEKLVNFFQPNGKILEPCKGEGVFLEFLPPDTDWCEINEGKDFFDYTKDVDWIITNPPWSQIRHFLIHSMEISRNVVFLMTINHVWTKARIRSIRELGFGIHTIILINTPKEFPASGFQLGAVYLQKEYNGPVHIVDWT